MLSGVLIITAFLAIISGALMTELSGNFMLSHTLMNRVANEATVNSAMELALNQLGGTPISAGCPSLPAVSINGKTAATGYISCEPVVDSRSPQYIQIAASSAFNVDGTHAVLPDLNDYIAGDSSGTVHDYIFGQTSGWSVALGGSVTAPPAATVDPSDPSDVSILVPVDNPTAPATGCSSSNPCVALLSSQLGAKPSLRCYMHTDTPEMARVNASPAAGISFASLVYFGDAAGNLYAFDATRNGGCAFQDYAPPSFGGGIVGGPVVFPGPPDHNAATDAIYTVASDGTGSELDRYIYDVNPTDQNLPLTQTGSIDLPFPRAVGIAVERASLPARLAVTFAGGQVALVQVQSNFSMSIVATAVLGTTISDKPYWCHCPGSTNQIGVGGRNGSLLLLDTSLNSVAALPAGGPAISTTPQSDGLGDWFFGADDGHLYEAQQKAGQSAMTVVAAFPAPGGPVGSGTQVGACPAGLCAYFGSTIGGAFIVKLDARDAVITACLSSEPLACSGDKPRLWVSVEVGTAVNSRTSHVQAWSYYSP